MAWKGAASSKTSDTCFYTFFLLSPVCSALRNSLTRQPALERSPTSCHLLLDQSEAVILSIDQSQGCPPPPLTPEIFITPQSSIETRHYVTPQSSLDVTLPPPPPVLSEEALVCSHQEGPRLRRSKAFPDFNHRTSGRDYSDFNLSMLSLRCQDDQDVEDKEGIRKRKRKKAEEETRWQQELEAGIETLPILGGFSVALVVGAPVYLAANIKLAMFAAIGGGIMGYTTGKMFSDWG